MSSESSYDNLLGPILTPIVKRLTMELSVATGIHTPSLPHAGEEKPSTKFTALNSSWIGAIQILKAVESYGMEAVIYLVLPNAFNSHSLIGQ